MTKIIDKHDKKVLDRVNRLYKFVYDKTLAATELSDDLNDVFAYIELQNNIAEAYSKFKKAVEK